MSDFEAKLQYIGWDKWISMLSDEICRSTLKNMSLLDYIYPLPVKYNNYNFLQWLYLNKHK